MIAVLLGVIVRIIEYSWDSFKTLIEPPIRPSLRNGVCLASIQPWDALNALEK